MAKEDTKDLMKFLAGFQKDRAELIVWLREFVWGLHPETNELIYDNYNALAIGWSPTEKLGQTFCSMAIMRSNGNVHFGFYWGNEISDPKKILLGKGNQYRYIQVTDKNSFPKTYIKSLVKEAYINSLKKIKDEKDVRNGLTIVKSISDKKREKLPKKKNIKAPK